MKIIIILSLFLANSVCFSKIYDRNRNRDLILPTQKMIEASTIAAPSAASASYVVQNHDGASSAAAATISSASITNPDVPRTLNITPTATTGDVNGGIITITGTDIHGGAVTEAFTIVVDQSTTTTGTKAFSTVTSIALSANIESGSFAADWNIGTTDALGLSYCMAGNNVLFADLAGTYESTRPTVTYDADEIEKNTIDLNSSYNGSSNVNVFYIQNYACLP